MKKTIKNVVAAIAMFVAVGAPNLARAEEYPKLDLRFAHFIPSSVEAGKLFQWWGDEIRKRSGGKINIQFFWSQSLGKSTELLELVGSGAVDMSAPAQAYYASKLPLVNVHQLPMVFPSNASAQLAAEDINMIDGVKKEHSSNNVVPLLWVSNPVMHIYCNKEIRTLKDFESAKIRSFGIYVPLMWKALGAVSVTVLPPEIYEGLQRGNIDCAYLPATYAYAYGLHQVAKYLVDVNFGAVTNVPAYVNADLWNGWPDNVKKLFIEVGAEAAERDRQEIRKAGDEAIAKMLAGGMKKVEFIEKAQLRKTVPDFIDIWVKEMEVKGLGTAAREIAVVVRKRVAEDKN